MGQVEDLFAGGEEGAVPHLHNHGHQPLAGGEGGAVPHGHHHSLGGEAVYWMGCPVYSGWVSCTHRAGQCVSTTGWSYDGLMSLICSVCPGGYGCTAGNITGDITPDNRRNHAFSW